MIAYCNKCILTLALTTHAIEQTESTYSRFQRRLQCMPDFSGQRIDKYYLIKRLGQGTFGAVYQAQDELVRTPNAYVAVKILRQRLSSQNIEDFLNEARAFRFHHPNIMPVKDFGVKNDVAFLVMDYTPYGTLRQHH